MNISRIISDTKYDDGFDVTSNSSINNSSSTYNSTSPSDSSEEEMPLPRRTPSVVSSQSSVDSSEFDNESVLDSMNSTSEELHNSGISNSESSLNLSHHSSNYDTANSSDTEAYDVEAAVNQIQNNDELIEINDTQMPNDSVSHINDDDDDDVIMIEPNIVTIDLCTQIPQISRNLAGEVIDITNSPSEPSEAGPIRRRRQRTSPLTTRQRVVRPTVTVNNHHDQPSTSSIRTNALHDTLNSAQPKVALTCPICLDTVVSPISTICGHIFCKNCINTALRINKKCPMCKKALDAKKPYFDIFPT